MLVHGWGMHCGFWREFAIALAANYRVTCVDLPGHGRSAAIEDYRPENIATLLAHSTPDKAHWIGWSLGATLVLFLAGLFPERVKSIGLIAANPKFSQDEDWPHAIKHEVLDQFNRNLIENFKPTLFRFLKVQTLGMESPRQSYRILKKRLNESTAPQPDALSAGVRTLKFADRRKQLESLEKPILAILGAKDSLVPVGVGDALSRLNPSIECRIIPNAGHIPFFTHRSQCLAEVVRFLRKQTANRDA